MATKTTKTTKTTKPKAKRVSKPKQTEVVASRPAKPVFGIGTWVTLFVLAALIGLSFWLNRQKTEAANEPTATPGTTSVFKETAGEPNSIEVAIGNDPAVRLERDENNAWAMILPDKVEANQGLAEAAASQAASLQFSLQVEGDESTFGLDQPVYVIKMDFADGSKHTLEVGDSTPTNNGYYVRVDNKRILVIELSGIDALTTLALFPPYLNTPTPTPIPPTETPVPPAATSTPAADVTITPTP